MRLADLDPSPPRLAVPDRLAVLHELLERNLRYAPEYDPGLASHLPMALAALHDLGAEPPVMQSHFANAVGQLVEFGAEVRDGPEVVIEGWAALRGRYGAFPLLRAHFATALARHGRDACLREALPWLVGGAGGAAFHGAIRVGHAVESGHDGELAFALAYWTARWIEVPAPRRAGGDVDGPEAWLDALDARLRAGEPRWRPVGRLIAARMQQAARTAAYADLGGAIDGFRGEAEEQLDALALAAARRYAATGNFTVLHLATGARALRVLRPWLDQREPLPAAAWHAVAAASLASGVGWTTARTSGSAASADAADWNEVRRRACASTDDHAIKLVHAMVQQSRRLPDDAWLAAARVAVSRSD